ncbi:MAG: GNAT family N-acetyltransferase [Streptomyces sp.]
MTGSTTRTPRVRRAVRHDLVEVTALATEHAAYEKSDPPVADLAERLAAVLFDAESPRVLCLVAETPGGGLAGYATCTIEFSTWQGGEYLYMDCLYLRDEHRGNGLGARLMDAVVAEAVALGLGEVQWQTPSWNAGAIRFYDRLGTARQDKTRFTLQVPRR